jgi:hypothetical protein
LEKTFVKIDWNLCIRGPPKHLGGGQQKAMYSKSEIKATLFEGIFKKKSLLKLFEHTIIVNL